MATKRSLPMGDDHDALASAADRVLGGDAARDAAREPVRDLTHGRGGYGFGSRPVRPIRHDDDDDDRMLPRRRAFTPREEAAAADRRRAQLELDDPGAFHGPAHFEGRGTSTRHVSPSDTWNAPFAKLGGITFTKRQLVDAMNNDLPRLIHEAMEESTQRGKFLRATLVPQLIDALVTFGAIPPLSAE